MPVALSVIVPVATLLPAKFVLPVAVMDVLATPTVFCAMMLVLLFNVMLALPTARAAAPPMASTVAPSSVSAPPVAVPVSVEPLLP